MKHTFAADLRLGFFKRRRRVFGRPQATLLFFCISWIVHSAFPWNLPHVLEGHLSGIVRDTNGAPVAGAIVSFHPEHDFRSLYYSETTSDKLGRYSLLWRMETNGLKGFDARMNPTNFILARQLEMNKAAIRVFTSFPTNMDLILEPGLTISGKVVDTKGSPLKNATADLMITVGVGFAKCTANPIVTDAVGRFLISALPQGHGYFFSRGFTVDGYGTSSGDLSEKDSITNRFTFPPFVLKRTDRVLMGQILGPDGKPLEKATIRISGTGQPPILPTHSDANGNFRFESLCDGELSISALWIDPTSGGRHLVMPNSMTATAGETNVILRMRDPDVMRWAGPQLPMTGTVYGPSGSPIPGVNLKIWRSANPLLIARSNVDGKYILRWQASHTPGEVNGSAVKQVLVAYSPGRGLAGILDVDEASTNLDLYLQPGLALSGMVQDTEGNPLSNALVNLNLTLNKAGGELAETRTGTNGLFRFNGLPRNGDYNLNVSLGGYSRATRILPVVDASRPNTLKAPVTQLSRANLTVEGRVVDADDNPVPGALVNMNGVNQIGGNARTDMYGHFVFKNVAKGIVMGNTVIPATNGKPAKSGRFTANGGDTNVVIMLRE